MTAAKTVSFRWKGNTPISQGLPWSDDGGGGYETATVEPGGTVKVPVGAKRYADGRTWVDTYRDDPMWEEVKPAARKRKTPAKPKAEA